MSHNIEQKSMKFIMRDRFLESIPENKKKLLLEKLTIIWNELILNEKKFFDLPKGFWGKKLMGSKNIFKFRLNSGDRILFTYAHQHNINRTKLNNLIILLEFCKHDDQVRIGRSIHTDNIKLLEYDLEINKNEFVDEDFDISLDKKFYNYSIDLNSSISYIVDEKTYINLLNNSNDKYFFYLSDDQYKCVESRGPLLLSGSAGSGKTTVGLHKLMTADKEKKACYITFTDRLKKYSLDFFNKYNSFETNVDFFTINELCFNLCGLNDVNLINFKRFNDWREQNFHKHLGVKNFSSYDLWAEIRGIIKGCMGNNWIRNRDISTLDLPIDKIESLKKLNLIEIINDKKYWKNDNYESLEELKLILNKLEIGSENIKRILKFLFESPKNLIDYQTYINLPNKQSIYSVEERKNIYKFAVEYQIWLDENGYFDDNDLVIEAFNKIHNKNLYDFIVVDEVQDFTELQIYFINKIISDHSFLFYTGDIHQNINPTYFSYGRLKNYYYLNKIEPIDKKLSKNYRSQEKIIKIANHLISIRKDYIGALSDDYFESSINRVGNKPKILKPAERNREILLRTVVERAYAAIIVSTEKEKELVKKEANTDRVFTVQEIKGLEYNYIIAYNILSNNINDFDFILSGNAGHNQKYRYYFNLFYVAITRAKDQLLLYEEKFEQRFLSLISEHFEIYEQFSEEELELTKFSTKEEWKKEAIRLEENGNYEQAKDAYKKADDSIGIKRIESKILESKGKFREAGLKMMELDVEKNELDFDDIEYTIKQFDRIKDTDLLIASYIWSIVYFDKIEEIKNSQNIDVFEKLYNSKYLDGSLKYKLINKYFEPQLLTFGNLCHQVESLILNLQE